MSTTAHHPLASRQSNVSRSARVASGFTLVELTVVVAVVALLSAIAAPNFIEALTRSRVAAAKSNLRMLDGGLVAYRVDHNAFPASRSIPVEDPAGIFADRQLAGLTTPVAYVSSAAFHDPFGDVQAQALGSGRPAFAFPSVLGSTGERDDEFPLPEGDASNPNEAFLYFHYPSFAARSGNPAINVDAVGLVSLGPDLQDSFGAFAPFPSSALPALARAAGYADPLDTLYDPTNGTTSRGDIPRFSGALPSAN
jgi:prepilin-type N-terminal cleavage/methylation domain-containing protein